MLAFSRRGPCQWKQSGNFHINRNPVATAYSLITSSKADGETGFSDSAQGGGDSDLATTQEGGWWVLGPGVASALPTVKSNLLATFVKSVH